MVSASYVDTIIHICTFNIHTPKPAPVTETTSLSSLFIIFFWKQGFQRMCHQTRTPLHTYSLPSAQAVHNIYVSIALLLPL